MSLVLVSHSKTLAEGLRDMVVQVAGEGVRVTAAGGTADGRLGTNAEAIGDAIRAILAEGSDDVLVLLDLGSAWLSVELALEELSDTERARVCVSEAPLVEGAVLAGWAKKGLGDAELLAKGMECFEGLYASLRSK